MQFNPNVKNLIEIEVVSGKKQTGHKYFLLQMENRHDRFYTHLCIFT